MIFEQAQFFGGIGGLGCSRVSLPVHEVHSDRLMLEAQRSAVGWVASCTRSYPCATTLFVSETRLEVLQTYTRPTPVKDLESHTSSPK